MNVGIVDPLTPYVRDGIFTPEEVFKFVIDIPRGTRTTGDTKALHKARVTRRWNGHPVKMDSHRYIVFKTKGCVCVTCGIVGTYFALECRKSDLKRKKTNSDPTYHFNLYGIDAAGNEVMLTKDHIVPVAKGGENVIDNYQPMCIHCNRLKADIYNVQIEA